ncbi:hypothetical protein LCGC14_0998920 [marine sediment metagenome]|uniref:Uncharacterized protein n=1 Tax=marine sediment metagenome TaxID=412755 RepID=A0A0F9R9V0_9ZZZZ
MTQELEAGSGVVILLGEHKKETGLVIRHTGQNAWEILTLAGHTHVYSGGQVRALYPATAAPTGGKGQ